MPGGSSRRAAASQLRRLSAAGLWRFPCARLRDSQLFRGLCQKLGVRHRRVRCPSPGGTHLLRNLPVGLGLGCHRESRYPEDDDGSSCFPSLNDGRRRGRRRGMLDFEFWMGRRGSGSGLSTIGFQPLTPLGISLRGRIEIRGPGRGSAAPPGQQPMEGERGFQELRNGIRLGGSFSPHWLPSRREGATWLGISWASRFAGGLEGRGPGRAPRHVRQSRSHRARAERRALRSAARSAAAKWGMEALLHAGRSFFGFFFGISLRGRIEIRGPTFKSKIKNRQSSIVNPFAFHGHLASRAGWKAAVPEELRVVSMPASADSGSRSGFVHVGWAACITGDRSYKTTPTRRM